MGVLERFAAGDADAFESIFRQYQGEVYRWIMRIVRNPTTAEELTVETFWRLYRARARFDPAQGNCGAWLRRIATNAAIDELRRSRHEVPLLEDPADTTLRAPGEQRELRGELLGAFNKLSPKIRIVVLLALVEEESYATIAESLGISEEAVKLRVFRGVRTLRKALRKAGVHS